MSYNGVTEEQDYLECIGCGEIEEATLDKLPEGWYSGKDEESWCPRCAFKRLVGEGQMNELDFIKVINPNYKD